MKLATMLVAGTCLFAFAAHADQLADMKASGKLVCGVPSNYVPFSFLKDPNDRMPVGYDIDVCKAIAASLGLQVELKSVTGASRIPDLTAGRIDVVTAALTITPERAQQIDFSVPYFRTGVRVAVPVDSQIKALADLDGKRIAVPESGLASTLVAETYKSAKVVGFPTPANTFLALEQGKVQAMAGDETTLLGQLAGAPGKYHLLEGFLSDDRLGVGVRKGETAVLQAVNKALVGMEAAGSALDSFNTWFGPQSKLKMTRNFTISANGQQN